MFPDSIDNYRNGVRLCDLRELARAESGEATVRTYYGWRETRALAVARGAAGSALTLLSAWLIPFLKSEYHQSSVVLIVAVPVVFILALSTVGVLSLLRMDTIHRSYVRAAVWLERFR